MINSGEPKRSITVNLRLRPLRLAFLIPLGDRALLRRAFQINTCLWGGRYNPIIPVFRRTPIWWSDFRPNARAIVQGYLDAFEPDYIVEMTSDLINGLDIPRDRLISASAVLTSDSNDPVAYGANVAELYTYLYEREFQFQRRHPVEVVLPVIRDRRMEIFASMCFGEFPPDDAFAFLARYYRDAFDARELQIDGGNLLATLTSHVGFPLRMGTTGLRAVPRGWAGAPILYFMDATRQIDLIDFWNLRAIGKSVLPVPIQWSAELSGPCSNVIAANYQRMQQQGRTPFGTTMILSRSLTTNQMETFSRTLTMPGDRALATQRWYPRLWEEWARDKDHVLRWDVIADEREIESNVQDRAISFRDLSPNFTEPLYAHDTPRWADVITLREYSGSPDSASIIPRGLENVGRLLQSHVFDGIRATDEGIVILANRSNAVHHWTLPTGLDVFRAWARAHRLTLDLSSSGKIALQMIRRLGGVLGIGLVDDESILELIERMAAGMVETELPDESEPRHITRVRSKMVSVGEWRSRLRTIHGGDNEAAVRHLEGLVERRVLQAGLRIQCPLCGQHNWFDLGSASEELVCERCLQRFSFPSAEPPQDPWYYRVIGPFAVGSFAQGAYSVAMAIRFFKYSYWTGAECTWIPSFELRGKGLVHEADFGMFWRKSSFDHSAPFQIFGECKTYEQFAARDVRRMRNIAEAFPGSVIVFCTLRKELRADEKKRIISLARWGRKHLKDETWRNPVLVLTGVELLSMRGPPYCWEEAGGEFARFADLHKNWRGGVNELSDLSQQLHLGMESYWTWMETKWKKRHQRKSLTPT